MDLLKVFITDDEESIRNGLKVILDWNECGCKICGEANNGKDAIQSIIDIRPDIILLDIKMPGFTGLEVMKSVSDYYEKNKLEKPSFIILSGFADFEYAKEALNLGAKSYILKPIDEEELLDTVKKIVITINNSKNILKSSQNVQEYKINEILLKIFNNDIVDESEVELNDFFSSNGEIENKYICIIMVKDKFYANYDELLSLIKKNFSFFKYKQLNIKDNIILCVRTSNVDTVNKCLERISKISQRTFICKGENLSGINGLQNSYKMALEYTKKLFYFSKIPFVDNNSIEKKENININIGEIIDVIIFCIETYDKNKLEAELSILENQFFNIDVNESETKKQLISFMLDLKNKLVIKYPERDFSDEKLQNIVSDILEKETFYDIFCYLRVVTNNLLENFNFNTSESVIIKVISYIKNNFTKDLKLETLGEMFNCNSAYLGKKFKKYTGVQFNNYVDNLRIDLAKEKLQNSNLKIFQISKLSGYTNTDYFFMKFKKNTGMTPREYKKNYNKDYSDEKED